MKFIYACTCNIRKNTLTSKGRIDLKGFAVYFYCFSDNCSRASAGGNESDSHLNRHDHFFNDLLDL